MKSKRFSLLIALISLALLACTAFGATAALADETADNAKDYFTVAADTDVKLDGNNLVFEFNKSDAKVTSTFDFYLPQTAIEYTAEGISKLTVNGKEYTSGEDIGSDAGKLELSITLDEGSEKGTVTVSGITTAGKSLYAVEEGKIKATAASAYLDKIDLADQLLWGYEYEDVNFKAYHGFLNNDEFKTEISSKKQAYIVYGENVNDCESAFKYALDANNAYEGEAVVKEYALEKDQDVVLLGNTVDETDKKYIVIYYGLKSTDYTTYAKKELTVQKTLDGIEDLAPKYVGLEEMFKETAESTVTAYDKYLEDVAAQAKEDGEWKYVGSTVYYTIPSALLDYIQSEYFTENDLTYVIYYKLPGSTDFTKTTTTNKRFSLTKTGSYEFYVLAKDPMGNEMTIDEEWEYGFGSFGDETNVRGFYSEKEGVKTLEVPVFTFDLGNNGPQVTADSSYVADGFKGTRYTKINAFTTKGNIVKTEYTLWYNPTAEAKWGDAGWKNISTLDGLTAANAEWDEEEWEDLNWDSSSRAFTPIEMGSYVIQCEVYDAEGQDAIAQSKVINVASEMKRVTIDTTSIWFEKNWKSVMFLSIALLSLVGIIVLLFVKPKEEVEEK